MPVELRSIRKDISMRAPLRSEGLALLKQQAAGPARTDLPAFSLALKRKRPMQCRRRMRMLCF